jgi:L-lactate dehydrogenase complex protein LldG
MNTRDAFLQRVRQAVTDGNRPGHSAELPQRRALGYQGGGPDPVIRFCEEMKSAGGFPHVAKNHEHAWQIVAGVIESKKARKIVMGRGGMIDQLGLAGQLRQKGLEVTTVDMLQGLSSRDVFFGADIGISNVAYLVAETGSVVMETSAADPRSLSLLPPVHVAIADRSQLLPDLFDLFDLFSPLSSPGKLPPSCLTLITGPSKTGDIELRLVTGVHGPGEIHVVLCGW